MKPIFARHLGGFVVAAVLAAGHANAEDPTPEAEAASAQASAEARAKALFEVGQEHYERGEYQAAVTAFREAQGLWPNPELLYNLAQAERLSGECRSALEHYRAFEAAGSDAPADLQEKIAEMEHCSAPSPTSTETTTRAASTATVPAAPEKSKPAREPEHADPTLRVLGWLSLGGAAVSAALGTHFVLEAHDAKSELDSLAGAGGEWSAHYQSLEDSVIRNRNLAIGCFVGAGVLAGTGTWLLLSPPTSSNGNGLAVEAGGRF